MKNFFFCLLFFCSCSPTNSHQKNIFFDELDFTFDSGWKEAYSVRITKTGLIFVGIGRWNKKYYNGKISEKELMSLDSLLNIMPFNEYDTAYRTDIVDQFSYKIVTSNTSSIDRNRSILVYGDTAPPLIKELSSKIKIIKEKTSLNNIDTSISFLSEKGFYPPGHSFKP